MSTDFEVPQTPDQLEQDSQALQGPADGQPQTADGDKPQEPDLPEKYRGKTVHEIIEMHVNAERELGRVRNEVGTVRRLADELLGINRAHLTAQTQEKPKERTKLTTDALFEDPDRAITEVVRSEAEERERRLSERLAMSERALALSAFEKKHPTFRDTMNEDTFIEWVQQSPYRMRLAQATIQDDFHAADELFSLYKEARPAQTASTSQSPNPDLEAARKASLSRGGAAAASGVGGTSPGKKIWSRAELIQMRINDPQKFDSLYESEILPAYAEKRVR